MPQTIRLPSTFSPTPDPLAHYKRLTGRTLDRTLGFVWWFVNLLGGGSTAIGIFNILIGIGLITWWGLRT